MTKFKLLVFAAVLGGLAFGASAQETIDLVSRTKFRVCADPSNLPFSDDKLQGFQNKIADLMARDLREPVSYTWYPRTVGFLRRTLFAYRCDVVMGTVAGGGETDSTNPYYRSAYMIVTRSADGLAATSLADPVFAGKRFGVIAGTPPTDLLVRHNLMTHATPYELQIDTRYSSSAREMLRDLVARKIDVALLWGPYAGYFIARDHLPLHAALLASDPGGPRLDYRIAMGVRHGEATWRRTLNRSIGKHRADITRILLDYHIPLLDEQDHLITEANSH